MWFIVVLIVVGIALGALALWMPSKGVRMKWYEWLIAIVGLLLVLFGVQNYIGMRSELESTAANLFLGLVSLPGLILMVVAWQLSVRHKKAT